MVSEDILRRASLHVARRRSEAERYREASAAFRVGTEAHTRWVARAADAAELAGILEHFVKVGRERS